MKAPGYYWWDTVKPPCACTPEHIHTVLFTPQPHCRKKTFCRPISYSLPLSRRSFPQNEIIFHLSMTFASKGRFELVSFALRQQSVCFKPPLSFVL